MTGFERILVVVIGVLGAALVVLVVVSLGRMLRAVRKRGSG